TKELGCGAKPRKYQNLKNLFFDKLYLFRYILEQFYFVNWGTLYKIINFFAAHAILNSTSFGRRRASPKVFILRIRFTKNAIARTLYFKDMY
ncbi:hypothetical protein, partial [uncultured Brachyspira sp.]|uniref:hypothetical protein n=1 Tax=uncultured Brachyspira sp. TaxID=221953 RepID=UPI002618810B